MESALRFSVGRFDGYAVGGLSVGEDKADMYAMLDVTVPELPSNKPRYSDGRDAGRFGEGVAGSICSTASFPLVMGRTGWLFTSFGRVVIKQARYAGDEQLIDPACTCPVLHTLYAAYLHHCSGSPKCWGSPQYDLIICGFAKLMEEIRSLCEAGTFQEFCREFHRTYVVDRADRRGAVGLPEYERVLTATDRQGVGSVAWGAGEHQEGAQGALSLVPFVLIFVIFYFMLILPQQKRRKQVDAMLAS